MRHTVIAASVLLAGGLCLAAPSARAIEKHDWLVRGRIVHAVSNDHSSEMTGFVGSGAQVDSDTSVEFDVSFFPLRRLGLELSTTVIGQDLEGTGSFKAMGEITDSDAFMPTFLVQWHPLPGKVVRPYVGLGVNYTTYFSEDASASLETALGGPTRVRMDDSFGVAGQIGMDIGFLPNWMVNVDVKYIDADTEVRTDTNGARAEMDVDTNPWVFATGIGYRF
jgi:outer membrane protein